MDFLTNMSALFDNFTNITWQMVVMWIIGGILIVAGVAYFIVRRKQNAE